MFLLSALLCFTLLINIFNGSYKREGINSYGYGYKNGVYIYVMRDSPGMGNVAGVPWYNVFNSNLGNNTGKGDTHILILFLATICVTFCKFYAQKTKIKYRDIK